MVKRKVTVQENEESVGRRSKNYTSEDKKLLIICINEHEEPIENKRSDAKATSRKTKAWEEVARKFNLKQKNGERSAKQLKELYKSMKKNSKIELHKIGTFTTKSTDLDHQIQDTTMVCPSQAVVEMDADCSVCMEHPPVPTPISVGTKVSTASEKRPSPSDAADTILHRLEIIKNSNSAKFEMEKIDLEMKKMEMENFSVVCKKKLEILDIELDIKKIEKKIKELEYKAKLSEYKMMINE